MNNESLVYNIALAVMAKQAGWEDWIPPQLGGGAARYAPPRPEAEAIKMYEAGRADYDFQNRTNQFQQSKGQLAGTINDLNASANRVNRPQTTAAIPSGNTGVPAAQPPAPAQAPVPATTPAFNPTNFGTMGATAGGSRSLGQLVHGQLHGWR